MLILTPDHRYAFEAREGSPSDSLVVKETWVENVYRIHANDFNLDGLERTRPAMLDIGANIGAVSVYCASMGAYVVAVEPDRDNGDILLKNLRRNVTGPWRYFPVAVTGEVGTARMAQGHGHSRIVGPSEGDIEVPTVTLEDVFADGWLEEVDVCKIDIEGSEYELIESAPRELLRRIRYLTLEFDAAPLDKFGAMASKLALDFSITTLGSPERGGYIYARRY